MLARFDVSYHRTPAALVESMSQWLRGILGARRGPEFKQVVLILRLIAVCGQGTSSLDPGKLLLITLLHLQNICRGGRSTGILYLSRSKVKKLKKKKHTPVRFAVLKQLHYSSKSEKCRL